MKHLYTGGFELREAVERIGPRGMRQYSGLVFFRFFVRNSLPCEPSDIGVARPIIATGRVYLIAMYRTAVPGLLLAGLISGCGSSVTLTTPTIPEPLLEQIPISIGLRMPENFEHFVHEENVYGSEEWSIDLGRSNAALFEQLFGHMFATVTVLGPEDDPQLLPLDALIEPSIDAFEFSTPNQSNTEAFAVWIRYRLKVYDHEGQLVSNWPVSAYGKSQTTTMGGSDALERAAILAMRDAAALMIMKFDDETRISSLAKGSAPESTPAIESQTDETEDTEVQTTALEGLKDEAG